jgi:two-component system, NarL family, nitrate/nitrite response regulator NarL
MTVKILLVDDNPIFLVAASQYLKSLPDVQVIGQASDGLEALVKVEQLQPDLVLLDISMPVLNGLEVARRLQARAQPPRIVFISINDSVAYRAAAQDLGAMGFVGKGELATDLPPIIEQLVGCQSWAGTPC